MDGSKPKTIMATLETPPCSWIDFGNLAIGIGTFVLAVVLGVIGWYNSKRDRKVHIADKRHDWINEFRTNVAEFYTVMNDAGMVNDFGGHEGQTRDVVRQLNLSLNKLRLLLDPKSEHTNKLLTYMGEMIRLIMVEYNAIAPEGEDNYRQEIAKMDSEIYMVSEKIISEKWEKIKNLKD